MQGRNINPGSSIMLNMLHILSWEGFSLEETLKPSFIRPLFLRQDFYYVKIAGKGKGAKLWQYGANVYCEDCNAGDLKQWSGLWLGKEKILERAGSLFNVHRELGLAISPSDRHLIFIAVFLSRATSWETNVLRWTHKIFEKDDIDELLRLDFTRFGSSFQLRQLNQVFKKYVEDVYPLTDPWETRRALLKLSNLGPKTADAYLLFSGIDASAAPIDRHALRMARRLGIEGKPPRKELCIKYTCGECPARNVCLRARLRGKYGGAAGWVQTAFYLHSTTYCSKNRCNECTLSGVCLDSRRRKILAEA
jgi:endonuclease III